MPTPLVTVVLAIRNRGGVRLENWLRSLRWQVGVEPSDVEVLITDYGSDPEQAAELQRLAPRYGATVIRVDDSGPWNKPRALNIAIKRARGRYVMTTDVDMIYAPNYLRSMLDVQAEHRDGALVLCQCHDLGPETVGQRVELADLPALRQGSTLRSRLGIGGCMAATTAWFHHARGFDQRMTRWGAEDQDLADRAARSGLTHVWMSDRTSMLHQYHPTLKYDSRWQTRRNRWRLRLTGWIVQKNWLGWGE